MQKSYHFCSFFCAAHSIPARRSKHCYSEAQRVLDFQSLCQENKREESNDKILRQLGSLMNASQESCRDLYNCSCPELDRLVEICRWVCHFLLLWCRPSEMVKEITTANYLSDLALQKCPLSDDCLVEFIHKILTIATSLQNKTKNVSPLFVDKWPNW